MSKLRPSLALLVVLALVAASVGTALGASGVSAAKSKKKKHSDAKADASQFKKLLAISAPGLSVAKAATATNASHAASADHATGADKLGGSPASAFQLRVSGTCTGNNAIQSIAAGGTVGCQPTGTLTGVTADTGLTGGGTSGTVSLALDPNYRLPQGCSADQIPSWSGSAWTCAADSTGADWARGGNAGTNPGSNYVGTSDNQPLNLDVNGQRAFRLEPDAVSPNVIGGYSGNSVTSGKHGATIGGGGSNTSPNSVTDHFGTVAGGANNTAGNSATASGSSNVASGTYSTALGRINTASNQASTALGFQNAATGDSSTAFGSGNVASGSYSTAFGLQNNNISSVPTASGDASTAIGYQNKTPGLYSTAIGYQNQTPGTTSFAVGGTNTVSGTNSFGGGNTANVPVSDDNTFVWSDGNGGAFSSSAADQFYVRSTGGFRFQTNSGGTFSHGCNLSAAGTITCDAFTVASDRHMKHRFAAVSGDRILAKIAQLPITTWAYKTDPSATRHIGPMAQDFKAAFHVGNDPRSIGLLDEGGVALAGVQGLNRKVHRQQAQIDSLKRLVKKLAKRH